MMERLQVRWSGTLDRGDGEVDLSADPPACPERCGGDAYLSEPSPTNDPEGEVWLCSDCDGRFDGFGYELEV